MKDKLITTLQASMATVLNSAQREELRRVLTYHLHGVEVTEPTVPDPQEIAETQDCLGYL